MEVRRGLVYPRQTMLDDVQIDTSSYVVVKVDMVHCLNGVICQTRVVIIIMVTFRVSLYSFGLN
jgi:hypothetical protein